MTVFSVKYNFSAFARMPALNSYHLPQGVKLFLNDVILLSLRPGPIYFTIQVIDASADLINVSSLFPQLLTLTFTPMFWT